VLVDKATISRGARREVRGKGAFQIEAKIRGGREGLVLRPSHLKTVPRTLYLAFRTEDTVRLVT
jgi:hypothetical protein